MLNKMDRIAEVTDVWKKLDMKKANKLFNDFESLFGLVDKEKNPSGGHFCSRMYGRDEKKDPICQACMALAHILKNEPRCIYH